MEAVDVVVVGAGPVGLLAAIELKLGGASVRVLERLTARATFSKALGIGPLGIEALQRRGMAAAIEAAEARALAAIGPFLGPDGPDLRGQGARSGGHFGGLMLLRRDVQREPDRRTHLVDQPEAEAMLAERAHALGIEVERGCEATALAQDADSVELAYDSPAGADRISCAWLVGCDGGRSTIRKLAGFRFPGTPPTMTLYTAALDVDRPELLRPLGWHRTASGVFAYGPFPRRLFMLDFSGPPADRLAPVTREEIELLIRRISDTDIRVTALDSARSWTDNTRLADTYRCGRVLLAGDAAHVHSPFGGQGMSLGLVDAANLGWKLAAVVRGEQTDTLLDTYTAERRPVAEAVLANTLAQAAIMRPDPQSGAMREILAGLMQFDDVNRRIGEMVSGLGLRYDLGSARDEVGRLVADTKLGTTGLYDLMQHGAGVFLDATTDGRAADLVAPFSPTLRRVVTEPGRSMLIRPDACIAWAGDGDGADGLAEALARWFTPGG